MRAAWPRSSLPWSWALFRTGRRWKKKQRPTPPPCSASPAPAAPGDAIAAGRAAGFDLVMVETAGIGQGDAAIVPHVDASLYVMTPEFGAASQLEKIDMLDFADFVAINKFDRRGAEDALRDVRKQVQRNREAFRTSPDEMPVFGTVAARFNDDGVTALYHAVVEKLVAKGLKVKPARLPKPAAHVSSGIHAIVPPQRTRYLAEIAETVRGYHQHVAEQSSLARERQQLLAARSMLGKSLPELDALIEAKRLDPQAGKLLDSWADTVKSYSGDEQVVKVRHKELRTKLTHTSLSGTKVSKVALPKYQDHGELLRWRMRENIPGEFPFTAGVFHFKRENEDPTRMFAGEGDPFRTNKRFHLLSRDMPAKRLSTAFDSVTLYGFDPDERHGTGGHLERGPGTEHLHLLDRILAQGDGRHPGVLHRERGEELLLGFDLRLPHRRGRGEPDLAARLHARQRLHLRRGLSRPRHEHRRFRAEPVVLLLVRHGSRIRRARPRGAAHLGGGDEAALRRQRAQPEAQVPLAALGPLAARAGNR